MPGNRSTPPDALPAKPPADSLTPVPSPRISLCRIDATTGLCIGCWRTLEEIAAWSALGDDARRSVWAAIAQRRADETNRG